MDKRGKATLYLAFIFIIIFGFIVSLFFYFYYTEYIGNKPLPPKPIRNTNRNSVSGTVSDLCKNISDNYILPDFDSAKMLLENQDIVKDVPDYGKISIKFYHFIGNCRIWDKTYFLSAGKIEEEERNADIEIWMSSDYVSKINENNLCEIVPQARNNGDLQETINIGDAQLLWTYRGMLKYKSCFFGEGAVGSFSPGYIIERAISDALRMIREVF